MARQTKSTLGGGKDVVKLDRADFPEMTIDRAKAEVAQSAVHRNAFTARMFAQGGWGDTNVMDAVEAMVAKTERVKSGDMSDMESLLVAQATALDSIFNELSRRASMNMGEYLGAMETYLRLALKAQSQCRTTVEALAEIKNPRQVAIVKQANIAHGPQQVNNSQRASAPHAHGNPANQSNELSGSEHELLPNTRASAIASRFDTPMEAVGEVNGTKDRSWEENELAK